jgi:hypothetical protein
MTAIAGSLVAEHRETRPSRRIWNVVKLQYTNRWNMLALPWIVLGVIFVLSFAIWLVIFTSSGGSEKAVSGTQYSGGTSYIFIYMMVVAIQAINLTFPFALGYSVTRRDYYLGTALTWVIQSAMFTAGFVILSYIEQWTNGWGVGGHLFSVVYFGNGPLWERLFTVFALFLFFAFVGTVAATVYVRWKSTGLVLLGIAFAVLLVGAIAAVTLTESWPQVGQWFVDSGTTGVVAWTLIPTALSALLGFFILRKATPKS